MNRLTEPVGRPLAIARACALMAVMIGTALVFTGHPLGLIPAFGGCVLWWGAFPVGRPH